MIVCAVISISGNINSTKKIYRIVIRIINRVIYIMMCLI